jgi:hypothetical protein
MMNPHKTNVDWYIYPDLGYWYRLVDGTLQGWPLTVDGPLDEDDIPDIDLAAVDAEERERLFEVIRDLRAQP